MICVLSRWRALFAACRALSRLICSLRARSAGPLQAAWLALAGVATGGGIWATHFIAMLAYRPGVETAYDIPLTVLSLAATAGITTCGFWVALRARLRATRRRSAAAWLGSALRSCTMSAWPRWKCRPGSPGPFRSSPRPSRSASRWAPRRFRSRGATARSRPARPRRRFILAILAHHFIAMSAVILVPDPARAVGSFAFDPSALALAIAGAAFAALGMSLIAVLYDRRLSIRAAQYERAQRELVQAVRGAVARAQHPTRRRAQQHVASLMHVRLRAQADCLQ